MKKLLAFLLALMTVFTLTACNRDGSSGNTDTAQVGEETSGGSEQTAFEAPLLDLLGLADIAPAGVTQKEVKHDWADQYKGEYNFCAPVDGDAAVERMEYANKVLAAIQAVSDDGNAYRDVFTAEIQGWIIAEPYTAGIDTAVSGMPGYYFYKDGMVISLAISEEGSTEEHHYSIFIQKEADNYIQYNGNG